MGAEGVATAAAAAAAMAAEVAPTLADPTPVVLSVAVVTVVDAGASAEVVLVVDADGARVT